MMCIRQTSSHGREIGRQGTAPSRHSFLFCFLHESCIFTHLFNQVLLPEYGGMQVKIDDKELFMFRQTRALFVDLFLERCHVTPRCRDDEILGVLKSE